MPADTILSESLTPPRTERNSDDDGTHSGPPVQRTRSDAMEVDHPVREAWRPLQENLGYPPAVHQATGRLMARFSIDPPEALGRLRELATGLNRPLNEVAQEVALGQLHLDDDGAAFDLGPTADADLALLGQHHADLADDIADDSAVGTADPAAP